MNDLTGQQLKDYRVLRRLGRGAMAEVYLAEQQSLARQVAIKVLNAELARDPRSVERFQHEARAAASLVHGNIVQIHEVGCDSGIHFIAQEYVAGRDLGELIRRQGRVEPGLALDILRQVAAALYRAAEHGIVHRDIKPENILFSQTGEVKVADFGLSRIAKGAEANLTQAGVTMGTPLYMSPEQIEGRPVDSRSDIYSLGVTTYHMLAGEPPFQGETALVVAVQHLNKHAEPLSQVAPDIPEGLTRVVERMMSKKPADRYDGPLELLTELRELARRAEREGWSEGPDSWSISDMIAAGAGRSEATARLEEVMRTASMATLPPRSWRRGAVLLAGGLSLGALLAFVAPPEYLLQGVAEGPAKKQSVLAQLFHAKIADTEAAWLAVGEHFPAADRFHLNLARQGLIRYYLTRGRSDEALREARQLAGEPGFEAFGTATQLIALVSLAREEQALGNAARAAGLTQEAVQTKAKLTADMQSEFSNQEDVLQPILDEAINALNALPDRAS